MFNKLNNIPWAIPLTHPHLTNFMQGNRTDFSDDEILCFVAKKKYLLHKELKSKKACFQTFNHYYFHYYWQEMGWREFSCIDHSRLHIMERFKTCQYDKLFGWGLVRINLLTGIPSWAKEEYILVKPMFNKLNNIPWARPPSDDEIYDEMSYFAKYTDDPEIEELLKSIDKSMRHTDEIHDEIFTGGDTDYYFRSPGFVTFKPFLRYYCIFGTREQYYDFDVFELYHILMFLVKREKEVYLKPIIN